ncbi:MAG: hypothetical protein A3F18_02690 [Legionellales bacterium RIFCSPHIGHO2_12_FULL_37_14]|nr:MAG: hypothetical protein A3F18_02690 [Legionellales bacterium RIFCSPHIGHO2_12_FULL_37_14]
MSARRKIIIASPLEPCGATWLINCFLELGILTYRSPTWQNMWIQHGNHFMLSSREDVLKKWLPSLSVKQYFCFGREIEVEWVHEWPIKGFSDKQIIFFSRDPRDALYSRYKREAPKASFSEFVNFLDPALLLNKAEIHLVFTKLWCSHTRVQEFCFEEYKRDPEETLRSILAYINIDVSDYELFQALDASSSEKATEMERRWNRSNELDQINKPIQIVNQGGVVGRWQELTGKDKILAEHIVDLKMAIDSSDEAEFFTYLFFLKKNSLLKGVVLPEQMVPSLRGIAALEKRALLFSMKLFYQQAIDTGLHQGQISHLLKSLAALAYRSDPLVFRSIVRLYKKHIGSASQLYLWIFRKTRRVSALLHCSPFYILKLILKQGIILVRKYT